MIKAVIFDYDQVLYRYVLLKQKPLFVLAEELRAKNIKTAVLTNRIPLLAILTRLLGSVDEFSPVIFCKDVGNRKPHPKPYKLMLRQLNLKPEECLYIDNRQENIEAAKSLDMKTVLAKNTTQTVADIKAAIG